MSSCGSPNDNSFVNAVNPYMNELKMHPKVLLLKDGKVQVEHVQARGFPGTLGSIDCMHWDWKNCVFGCQGSNIDIIVLKRFSVFTRLAEGDAPPVQYDGNGQLYDKGYYLPNGIYPQWLTLLKTIRSRWAIVRHPPRTWSHQTTWEVMTACPIIYNMIVEEERDESVFDQG
nr:uncharacterized protein LOC127325782 [Lolium perenne]